MTNSLEEIIESMDYFSCERSHHDWSKFLHFLDLIGFDPVIFPLDTICDPDDVCDYDFVPLFSSLEVNEWSLYYDTRDSFGTHNMILLWWKRGECQMIEFKFVPTDSLLCPTVQQMNANYLQHHIPLVEPNSTTTRFLYLWYFLIRLNPATHTIDLPLPELPNLQKCFSNTKKFYEEMLCTVRERQTILDSPQSKKRRSPLRTSTSAKRKKLDFDSIPFPEFEQDSGYAHLFTPQTLEKYLVLLDRVQKVHTAENDTEHSTFLDVLVKIQNLSYLFATDVYLVKKSDTFRDFFPTGHPKLTKLKNLAGFLFEMFTDLVGPGECKVIFGTWEQQTSILSQLNNTPQGSLIDIVSNELGDKEYLLGILRRYLFVRQCSDLTAST